MGKLVSRFLLEDSTTYYITNGDPSLLTILKDKILGEGSGGIVFQGKLGDKDVAIKTVSDKHKNNKEMTERLKKDITREYKTLL